MDAAGAAWVAAAATERGHRPEDDHCRRSLLAGMHLRLPEHGTALDDGDGGDDPHDEPAPAREAAGFFLGFVLRFRRVFIVLRHYILSGADTPNSVRPFLKT